MLVCGQSMTKAEYEREFPSLVESKIYYPKDLSLLKQRISVREANSLQRVDASVTYIVRAEVNNGTLSLVRREKAGETIRWSCSPITVTRVRTLPYFR